MGSISSPSRRPPRASVPHGPCVVLGSAPAVDGAPAWAHDSRSGARLAELAGVNVVDLARFFALDNLLPYAKPEPRALRQAGQLYQFLPGWWYVVAGADVLKALGRRARPADAAGWWDVRTLEWFTTREGVTMALLPHPSGRNRWYNTATNREAAERFLRAARCPEISRSIDDRRTGSDAHRRWRADRARHDVERRQPRRPGAGR